MKKGLILIFIIFTLFINCNKKETTNIITFEVGGTPDEIKVWEDIIKKFENEKNIKVNILRQPTDTDLRRQGLLIALRSKQSTPDVFLMDVAWIAQFAGSDYLTELDDFIKKNNINLNNFFTKVINLADKYNGNIISLPVYIDSGVLYYRKDLLEKYGFKKPPTTWEDLKKYAVYIQNKERKVNDKFYGFVWQGAQYEGLICNFLEFAGENGGILINDNKIKIATQENIKAVSFMKDLIYKYKISPLNTYTEMKEEEVRLYFQNGDALFERNWPYAWSLHQKDNSKVKGNIGIAKIPHFKNNKSVSTLGGWHIAISKYSKNKEKSFELVKYITSFNVQKELAMRLGWNPARRDVYNDSEVLKKLPHFKYLKDVFENAKPRPIVPYYPQISQILQKYVNEILAQKIDVKEGLKKAEVEINKIVFKYKK